MLSSLEQQIVLVSPGHNYGYQFWDTFLAYGQQKYGLKYSFIEKTPGMFEHFKRITKSKTQYEYVGSYNNLMDKYGSFQYDKQQVIQRLREFENRSNILIMDIIQADRNFGLGCYFAGRIRPSTMLSKRLNYWDTVFFIAAYIDYFDEILQKVKPAFFLSEGAGSLDTLILHALCRMNDVSVRKLSFSRYKNYYYWAVDEYEYNPDFKRCYESTKYEQDWEIVIPKGYKHYDLVTKAFSLQLMPKITKSFTWILNRCKTRFLSKVKGNQNFLETKLLQSFWIWFYRDWVLWQKIKALLKKQTIDYKNTPYVYFPLHIEPESSLNVLSYEFNNQLSLIDLITKALPVGVILLVKENRMGFSTRPQGFYDWLDELPNVCLAPMEVPGSELAQKSLATVTFTGTVGLEASAVGVPVVTFSGHNIYNIMSHVFYVTDFIELRTILHKLVNEPQPRDEWLKNGQRFLRAIETASMDMEDEYIQGGKLSETATVKLWKGLNSSFGISNS